MIKLFTLKNLSDFSSDAVYKICLALEKYGLNQSRIMEYDSYDELYFETIVALEHGEHIIVAAENEDYNEFKRNIISRLLLEEYHSAEIEKVIEKNAGEDVSEIDITGHSIVALDSICHFSRDGLYSGFTCNALLGKVTCLPLDFMRIDRIVNLFKDDVLPDPETANDKTRVAMPEFDFMPYISGMVSALKSTNGTMALSTSEATMWIYNYYDKIQDFNDVFRFVEVSDGENDEEATAESESVRIIRHAKEAMSNAGTSFGAAVSEVYSTVNDEGQTVYFAYAAVVDKSAAKAKKINTTNPDDLALILPHTVTVLTELVKNRVSAIQLQKRNAATYEQVDEAEEKTSFFGIAKMSKKMIAFAVAILAIAVISPIIMVALFFGGNEPAQPAVSPNPYENTSSTAPSTTEPQIIITPGATEPTAGDITVPTTQVSVSSTSGTFTFEVFGYGHGVGLSQHGADWLATSQGWSWSQILAHYYYCPAGKILTGDTLPETISYDGTSYYTRDFLASVLEAEMGSSFHEEALKAQYVAIYTYAKYKGFVLDRSDCAILGSGKAPSTKVYNVVDEMMSISPYIVGSDGKCALTPFHSISAGKTTSYYNTWGKNNSGTSSGIYVDYLGGARLSYGDTLLGDKYKTVFSISSADLKSLVESKTFASGNKVTLEGDPATWISVISHDGALGDQAGYVSSMRVGNEIITGNYFRINIMEGRIRSHCFYVTYTPDTTTVS